MDWYDTLLYLHMLAAFILVAANVTAWAMYLGTAGGSRPSPLVRMAPMGGLLGVVGSLGVLIFGIWLAIYVKGYEVWDGWVLAAIVLWAIAGYAGTTLGRSYEEFRAGTGTAPPLALHLILSGAILLLLIDMLWKPGGVTVPLLVLRPDDWNFPLLLHVGGAMVLTGAVVVAAAALVLSIRSTNDDRYQLVRFASRTLLFAGIPSLIVMRGAAAWIESKEGLENTDSAWLAIGYATAEGGALLIIVATILTWLAARRIRSNPDGPSAMTRISMALTFILIAAYVVAVWAMTAKPS